MVAQSAGVTYETTGTLTISGRVKPDAAHVVDVVLSKDAGRKAATIRLWESDGQNCIAAIELPLAAIETFLATAFPRLPRDFAIEG